MIIDSDENILYTCDDGNVLDPNDPDHKHRIIWDEDQGFMLEYHQGPYALVPGKGLVENETEFIRTKIVI